MLADFHGHDHFMEIVSGSNARKFKASFGSISATHAARVICLIVMDWEAFKAVTGWKSKNPIPTFAEVCGLSETALFRVDSGISGEMDRRENVYSLYEKHILKLNKTSSSGVGF